MTATSIAWRWYCLSALRELIAIFPVYAIMLSDAGLTPTEISTLLTVWSLAAFVFEVPSGTLADRFARKHILLLSRGLQAAVWVVWWMQPTFGGFLLGFVLWGLSGSLWSGTAEAWLYEALAEQQQEARFERIYGLGSALATAGIATSLFVGGYVAERGYDLALAASIAVSLSVALIVATTLGNPPRAVRSSEGEPAAPPLRAALADFRRSRDIRRAALVIAFALVFYGCFEEYTGVLFAEAFAVSRLDLGVVGLAYGACYVARAIAQAAIDRLPAWKPLPLLIFGSAPLAVAGGIQGAWWLLGGCIVYFAANGIAEVRLVADIQARTAGHSRATVLSLARLGILATGPVVYIVSGQLADRWGWIATAWVAGIGTIAAGVVLAFFADRPNRIKAS